MNSQPGPFRLVPVFEFLAIGASVALLMVAGATPALATDCRDLNATGDITTTDALIALRGAVGLGGDFVCPSCVESVCGDGVVSAFGGTPFGNDVEIATCLLLSVSNPDDPASDLDVIVVKALNASLTPVGNVNAVVQSQGCDCLAGLRADVNAQRSASTTVKSDAQISGEFCNCMVKVRLSSPEDLAAAELELDPVDGYCTAVAVDGAQTVFDMWGPMRIDAGVGEECDDGNSASGDGCSDSCLIETDVSED